MAMIIAELQSLEGEREPVGRDAMMLHQFLGIAPEPLQAVEVDPASAELRPMVDLPVTIPTEHEGIVDLKPVGVNDAPPADLLDRQAQHGLSPHVGHPLDEPPAFSFQEAKDRTGILPAAPRPRPRRPLRRPPKWASSLSISLEQGGPILGVGHEGRPQGGDRFVGRVVSELELRGHLAGGDFQLEELDQAQPLTATEATAVEPAAAEVVAGKV